MSPLRLAIDIGPSEVVRRRAFEDRENRLRQTWDGKPVLARVLGGMAAERALLPGELIHLADLIDRLCQLAVTVQREIAMDLGGAPRARLVRPLS